MAGAQNGHLDVVRALLEVGGRELVMLTDNDGTSCMYMSAQNVHLEMVKAMLEAGGCELVMPTMDDGASCLTIARQGFKGPSIFLKATSTFILRRLKTRRASLTRIKCTAVYRLLNVFSFGLAERTGFGL